MTIAVLIPCFNEEQTVGRVVEDIKKELPEAAVYVFDNNSDDRTAELAKEAGAIVRKEAKRGKGNVVRSMFRQVDADIYVMIDGDDTYPAGEIHKLIAPIQNEEADICIGDRLTDGSYEDENRRLFHTFGNSLVKRLINRLFDADMKDIMSGYRAFSRRFVKTAPIISDGFEIETEITLFALHNKLRIKQIPIGFRERPEGSLSKLNTLSDGFKVLLTIFRLYKDYRPFVFFSTAAMLLALAGIGVGIPVIVDFVETGLVPKFPSAILATGCMVLSAVSFSSGLILDTIVKHHRRMFEILYNQSSK